MTSDAFTRTLLLLILLGVATLVAQGFGLGVGTHIGRYQMETQLTRRGLPVVFRIDTATGAVDKHFVTQQNQLPWWTRVEEVEPGKYPALELPPRETPPAKGPAAGEKPAGD